MHTFSETGAGVPAFLAKLWRLVDDPKTDHLICWNKDGRSFIIQNQAQFARELLPQNYKHNNMASFIRQLNMYGFHKITSIENGGLKFDRDEMEFSHPCFKRNCPYLLEHIKRKIATAKTLDDKSGMKPEAVTKVLQDVKAMRGRQDSLDSRFSLMKQENEALWREIASLRQKHAKQQQIVNKLIHFLISVVQPSRNMNGVKRQTQLMINDNPKYACDGNDNESDCGPIIHELTEELLDEVANDQNNLLMHSEHSTDSPERPQSSMSMISNNYDFSNHSADDALQSGNMHTPERQEASTNMAKNSQIVYHVTEVPEGSEATLLNQQINEENHLATPMVRKQMQRSQYIKQQQQQQQQQNQRNNKRRRDTSVAGSNAKQMRTGPVQESLLLCQKDKSNQQQKQQYLLRQRSGNETPTSSSNAAALTDPVTIKCEAQDLNDPIFFLNVFPDNIEGNMNEEEPLASPVVLNNSPSPNVTLATTPSPSVASLPSPNLYSPHNFIGDDINQEMFEDAELLAANRGQLNNNTTSSDNNNIINNNNNFDFNQNQQLQQQQQQGYNTNNLSNGKFASFLINNTEKGNLVAANENTQLIPTSSADGLLLSPSTNQLLMQSLNDKTVAEKPPQKMAITKFKSGNGSLDNSDIMRLSTADDVHGHIENVQDELDSLKDLLRGDGYSLDTNTLMGNEGSVQTQDADFNGAPMDYLAKLFNDSDILNPFSMTSWQNEVPSNESKKGSELATYQPGFDLTDIMEMDKNSNTTVATPSTSRSSTLSRRSPTLDTPRHD